MIKKFKDEENSFVFIEADERLIMWLNGKSEYTLTSIASIPKTIEEAYQTSGLNIWYPIEDV